MTDSAKKPTVLEGNQASFEELLKFPCTLDFRIIVDALETDVIEKISRTLNDVAPETFQGVKGEPRVSSNGRYVSYTVQAKLNNADDLRACYKKISSLKFVKHML